MEMTRSTWILVLVMALGAIGCDMTKPNPAYMAGGAKTADASRVDMGEGYFDENGDYVGADGVTV
ncbi:hypothetical protein KKC87_02525, partial [Patescibacteria group bacterium]|nr:hypothetical protein [Patescibacteria group bacterium]